MRRLSIAALVLLTCPASAEEGATVPVSKEQVVFRVTAEGRGPATVKTLNGGMARITLPDGALVGITPLVRQGRAEVHLFEILEGGAEGAERLRQVERMEVALGVAATFPQFVRTIEVNVLELRPPAAQVDGRPCSDGTDAPCSRCCVTCDGITACACEVWMSCGYCCCDSAACGPCMGR